MQKFRTCSGRYFLIECISWFTVPHEVFVSGVKESEVNEFMVIGLGVGVTIVVMIAVFLLCHGNANVDVSSTPCFQATPISTLVNPSVSDLPPAPPWTRYDGAKKTITT